MMPRSQRTYEELKHLIRPRVGEHCAGSQRTYEELKLEPDVTVFPVTLCSQRTYEELKRVTALVEREKVYWVLSVPMRN